MNRFMELLSRISLALSLCAAGACASVDYEQAAFETLSRVQCENVEARGLCNRSFTSEYVKWRDDLKHYHGDFEREQKRGSVMVIGFDLQSSLVINPDVSEMPKQLRSLPGGE